VSLKKYAGWAEQDSAVGFYRIIQPARFLKRMNLVEESRTVPFTGENQTQHYKWSDKTMMEICAGADVLHTTLLWRQEDIIRCLNLREHYGLKWVVDVDDNIHASSADNPATSQAEALRPNREMCLSLADGLTVSVPSLKEFYGRLNKNIFVQSNGLDFKIWDRLKVKEKKKIRIGWRGAYGHKQDLELIRPVIEQIKKQYPKVEFVTFGWDPGFSDEHHNWVSSEKYPKKLADLGIDIALVPLVDSSYNRCKSNLNWLEWSALKVPVVYSPTKNNTGLPGFPASTSYDWFDAISNLIDQPILRKQRGIEQYAHLKEHYDMKSLITPLAKWFEELPRRKDITPS
jgi:hypothetical protein